MCEEYLVTLHKDDIIAILQDEDATKHFSISINFIVLYEHQPTLVLELLKKPEECLEEWDNATVKAQMSLLKEVNTKSLLKNNVHCRIFHLPGFAEVLRTIFPGNDDAGKFLQVSGTVMRMSAAKLLEYQRNYICVKCKYQMIVKAEYDKKYIIKQPKNCGNPEGCSGKNLITFGELDTENCKDFQEIKIQEQMKKQGIGAMPNTMWVTLEDDLVDSCKPGDNVTICGIVKRRWGELNKGSKIEIDIVLKANNVQVDNNSRSAAASTPEIKGMFRSFWEKYSGSPLAGRDLILKSFCPQIYGLYLVKLAIAMVLAGGSQIEDTTFTGVRTRSESHLLLVGDPGTGKSQLLRFASKIVPRSVLTTGVGSTAAGLTVTAMMEHGEWQLEGGALVMSDGGICCIDEFNSMKDHDRMSIHEAMEQQTISVAKASIVCKLNTRCSILAACNPKGNLDPTQPLYMSIALPSPLLSRFDLILLLRDVVNEEWDTQVADYILNGGNNFSKLTDSGLWSVDVLQSYFMVIKKFNPKLSEKAELILSTYYQMQRRIDSRNKARTTVRLLESLVRLSQGHARLMYHEEVETVDSIYAIVLVDTLMESDSSILNLNVSTHSVFPERPSRDYCNMLEVILNKLGLQDILNQEIESLRNTENVSDENVRSRFFNAQNKSSDIVLDNFKENIDGNIRDIEDLNEAKENLSQTISDSDVIFKKDYVQLKTHCIEHIENKKRMNIVTEVPGSSKRCKKPNETNDYNLDLDLDEGYDTVSFISSSISKNNTSKSRTEQIITSNKRKRSDSSSSNKKELLISINFPRKETCSSIQKTQATSKTAACNSDLATDLANGASSSSTLQKINDEEDFLYQKADTQASKVQTVSKNDVCNSSLSRNLVIEAGSSNIPETVKDKSPVYPRAGNKFKIKEKVGLNKKTGIPIDKIKEVKNDLIKNKLKKFKFVPKNYDGVGQDVEEVSKKSDGLSTRTETKGQYDAVVKGNSSLQPSNDFAESDVRSGSNNKTKSKKLKKGAKLKGNNSPKPDQDFIKDDLAMMKLIPSANDSFNIDLDFDWDNFEQNSSDMTQNNNLCGMTKKDEFADLTQNSKLKWIRKFSSDTIIVKKLSDVNISSKLVSSDSRVSSQSSKRTIFSTSDENFDDLVLDL